MALGALGIRGLLGLHYYVHDLERSRRFYLERLGFAEVGQSSPQLEAAGKQRSKVFQAGDVVITCSQPVGAGGRAARYLAKHPDGIGTLAFEVEDVARTFALLEERGGTPIGDVQRVEDAHGWLATFSITTPFGDTTFRFIERHQYSGLFPGMQRHPQPILGPYGDNDVEFSGIDHITSNFQTMQPALLWLEHVMGCVPLWEVSFHTRDVAKYEVREGSGLRSKVMWEPHSGIKFANNEPYRPAFKSSQINVFNEEHRGDGVQHAALATRDILGAVRKLRERGVEFMPTPHTYYEAMPERLREIGVGAIEESPEMLEELQILVDGSAPGAYLLQIFLKESAGLYGEAAAGPFFFEIIQRKGDQGFGAGNFRALFESIEREQQKGSG
ncbi:MAG TPA: VOC family protein [Polyangiales bacterium]|nr:VOC family protein [Polyangiales bacterium]